MRKIFISFLLLVLTVAYSANAKKLKIEKIGKRNPLLESRILHSVSSLPEVIQEADYVEKMSKGKRHLSTVIYAQPALHDSCYWVKVWEDNGMSYVSHFNFYVTNTLTIFYFDTTNDTLIDLNYWRNNKRVTGRK